jgi:phosphate starvation-inducible PhoH-like protein
MIEELAIIGEIHSFHKAPYRIEIRFVEERAMREIVGNLEKKRKLMERVFSVGLHQSGDLLFVLGEKEKVTACAKGIRQLLAMIKKGHTLRFSDFEQFCRLMSREPSVDLLRLQKECIFSGKKNVYPRSPRQLAYFEAMKKHDLVFGVGPAGTGKTYLAMAMALDVLHKEEVRKIVLCRPAVEAGEKLGFLPGDLMEKVDPYLRPLYDALYDLVGMEKGNRYIDRGIIEVAPLAFMRGRTLDHSFIILDEAQNTTPEQIKMFLTRFGMGSKVIVNGDPSQIDLPPRQRSGFSHAIGILSNIRGVAIATLTAEDVVRHPLVVRIIKAYAQEQKHAD